jgi:hypothetical protein
LNQPHSTGHLSAHDELLLDRCDFLVEAQLWPLERNLNYSGWLANFTEGERNFAERLLINFMYYSNDLTKHLFRFAFNKSRSCTIIPFAKQSGQKELDVSMFTRLHNWYVTDERPIFHSR